MHELSLTQRLLEIAETHAHQAGAREILSITVEIGDLCGALPEAIEFAFDVCRQGTIAERAHLHFLRTAGQGHCDTCRVRASIDVLTAVCPTCGQLTFEIDRGTQLRVIEIEIDCHV